MTVEKKIIALFDAQKELTVKELSNQLQVSKQMIHTVLKKLIDKNQIEKLGRAPKTIYRFLKKNANTDVIPFITDIEEDKKKFLEMNFLVVTETGNLLDGIEAFNHWCIKRKQPLLKTIDEFIKTKKKYEAYYEHGIINGTKKLTKTYGEHTYLNEVYYLDFYAIERFGKTRLGTLLHFAKQGQNKYLMNIMMNEISDRIKDFIKKNNIDAVGYVPPTIRREVQIMKYIKEYLNLTLPILDIQKISGIIPVPQKSLSKLEDRIQNAENTFAVTDQRKFKKVLLIDDAVGSGSTLNQIAEKIKVKKISKSVIGMAVVGSFKGFDVITDI